MCGIGGLIGCPYSENEEAIFLEANRRRGPDSFGVKRLEAALLTHNRLSVLDVSEASSQPFSKDSRYFLVFNGEIYNFKDLASEYLSDIVFETTGDTEILYEMLLRFGAKETCRLLKGMFAFAFLDNATGQLTLARDMFGEKPLYYKVNNGGLIFSSTLSPILKISGKSKLHKGAINGYLSFGYVAGSQSIISDIYKLEPSQILTWLDGELIIEEYYSRDISGDSAQSTSKLVDQGKQLLRKSVERQSISDVPLGSFLSGGIDSSLITAVLATISRKPVDTFTIGFDDEQYNEANHAREIAKYLGTNHHEEIITEKELLEITEILPDIYDEPFADSSQIPTTLVSAIAKKNVTVCLSGDGGDELFGGYSRYIVGKKFYKYYKRLTPIGRQIAASLMRYVPSSFLQKAFYFYQGRSFNNFEQKIERLRIILAESVPHKYYEYALRHWKDSELNNALYDNGLIRALKNIRSTSDYIETCMLADVHFYMQDDILVKVDRAAMYHSLETRAPFLDRDLYEFARGIPLENKIRGNQGKLILQQMLTEYIPKELFDRPKMGFGVPIDDWLRGPLRSRFEDYLSYSKGRLGNYLELEKVQETWEAHLDGYNNGYRLWTVFIFIQWVLRNEEFIELDL